MTDAEYVFRQDVKAKKQAASGAYHRVSGSKTKYVSLPSDGLTPAQLKRRNGQMITCDLNKPMGWKDFKRLSTDTQSAYLHTLVDRYHAKQPDIAEALGVSTRTLVTHVKAYFTEEQARGLFSRQVSAPLLVGEWKEFLRGAARPKRAVEDFLADAEKNAPATTHETEQATTETKTPKTQTPSVTPLVAAGALPNRGTLCYSGNSGDVLRAAYAVLGNADYDNITLSFIRKEAD